MSRKTVPFGARNPWGNAPHPMGNEGNGILRIFNPNPMQYGTVDKSGQSDLRRSLQQITQHIPEQAALGYNALHLLPVHRPGNVDMYRVNQDNGINSDHARSSFYAAHDPGEFNPGLGTIKDLQRLTQTAREYGMVPMFDLVLHHVSADSYFAPTEQNPNPILTSRRDGSKIQTSCWFTRRDKEWDDVINFNYEGLHIEGQDAALDALINEQIEHGSYNNIQHQNRTYFYNPDLHNGYGGYQTHDIRKEIFRHLWQPVLETYVQEWGFMGVRLDANAHIDPQMLDMVNDEVNQLCQQTYGVPAPRFGETLIGHGGDQAAFDRRDTEHTHTANAVRWWHFSREDRRNIGLHHSARGNAQLWAGMVFLDKHNNERPDADRGGSIGYIGNHDLHTLFMGAVHDWVYESYFDESERYWYDQPHQYWESQFHEDQFAEMVGGPEHGEENYPGDDAIRSQIVMQHHTTGDILDAVDRGDPETLAALEYFMLQRTFSIAALSDGGISVLAGGERGTTNPAAVYVRAGDRDGEPIYPLEGNWQNGWNGPVDLRDSFLQLNTMLGNLPRTNYGLWTDMYVLDNKPDMFIAVRHNGQPDPSNFFSGETDIIIGNLNRHQEMTLTRQDLEAIANLAAQRAGNNNPGSAYWNVMDTVSDGFVHVMGNITIDKGIAPNCLDYTDMSIGAGQQKGSLAIVAAPPRSITQ